MSDNLSHFLVDLASDSDRLNAFLADPTQAVNATSMSEYEKAAVLSRDSAQIRSALMAGPGDPTGSSKKKRKKKSPAKKKSPSKTKKSNKKK